MDTAALTTTIPEQSQQRTACGLRSASVPFPKKKTNRRRIAKRGYLYALLGVGEGGREIILHSYFLQLFMGCYR